MKQSLQLYRRLLGYARPYWRVVSISLLAMMGAAALEPVMPALLKRLIDEALIAKNPVAGWQLPGLLLLAFVFKGLAEYAANVASQWVAHRAVTDLRQQVFHHQTGLPLATHAQQTHGRMLSRVLYDIPQVGSALSNAWIIVVRDSLIIVGLTGYLLYTAWQLTLLIVLVAPAVALIIRSASKKLRGSNQLQQQLTGQMAGLVESALNGVKEIKIFGARGYEAGRFNALAERLRKATMKTVRVQAANVPLVQVLAAAAVSGIILVVTTMSAKNLLTPGEFVGFVTAMSMLFEPIRRLTNINATIQAGLAAAEGIFGLLDQPLEPDQGSAAVPRAHAQAQALSFRHVRFSYPGQPRPALEDFSLDLPPGRTVALVGASGSGKSTVTHLLARFYLPESGEILYGGQPIDGLPLADWRARLALVGQQVVLFDDTLAANIAYGRPDVPREAIERAARAAHAGAGHALRRERPQPLGRPAPAHRDRARLPEGRAAADPRRGHLGAGQRKRAPGAAGPARAHGRAHHADHRPPHVDHRACRPDRGDGPGPHRRAGPARRAAGARWPLHPAAPGAVRARGREHLSPTLRACLRACLRAPRR
jgi:subfamily B ATP-binding cassette protein MsbA